MYQPAVPFLEMYVVDGYKIIITGGIYMFRKKTDLSDFLPWVQLGIQFLGVIRARDDAKDIELKKIDLQREQLRLQRDQLDFLKKSKPWENVQIPQWQPPQMFGQYVPPAAVPMWQPLPNTPSGKNEEEEEDKK